MVVDSHSLFSNANYYLGKNIIMLAIENSLSRMSVTVKKIS